MTEGRPPREFAALVLCGGGSRRMGQSKAWLPFGSETMLERVVRRVGEAVDETIVVAAADQALPALPPSVRVAYDELIDTGPLAGLAAGLKSLGPRTTAVYVTGCDVPLVRSAFIARLRLLTDDDDCVVPHWRGVDQPLAAVYRASVASHVAAQLAEQQFSVRSLFGRMKTRRVDADELRDVDPRLESLMRCNTPEEYRAVRAAAGLTPL